MPRMALRLEAMQHATQRKTTQNYKIIVRSNLSFPQELTIQKCADFWLTWWSASLAALQLYAAVKSLPRGAALEGNALTRPTTRTKAEDRHKNKPPPSCQSIMPDKWNGNGTWEDAVFTSSNRKLDEMFLCSNFELACDDRKFRNDGSEQV